MIAEREAYREKQPELSERQLVFVDESAISTTLHHAYGRAPAGERVTLYSPSYGARRTLVGAVAVDGRSALAVLDEGSVAPVGGLCALAGAPGANSG